MAAVGKIWKGEMVAMGTAWVKGDCVEGVAEEVMGRQRRNPICEVH